MAKEDVVNEAEVVDEATVEADAKEVLTAVLAVVRDQDRKISALEQRSNQQDELLLGVHREIGLLAKAVDGHQRILEADHPAKPLPPAPPDIVH